MNYQQVSRHISGANDDLDRAIHSLIALDPAPEYLESLESAASLLAGVSLDGGSYWERGRLLEETQLLASRAQQAETLFHAAGALRFGTLLDNGQKTGDYGTDGSFEYSAQQSFHIDG